MHCSAARFGPFLNGLLVYLLTAILHLKLLHTSRLTFFRFYASISIKRITVSISIIRRDSPRCRNSHPRRSAKTIRSGQRSSPCCSDLPGLFVCHAVAWRTCTANPLIHQRPIQSSLDISRITASTSPGTTITELDRRVKLPTELESQDTLRYFGLNKIRVDQIWQLWKSINPYRFKGDFGDFARAVLGNRVGGERCDFGEPGVGWSPYLRRVGVDEKLIDAIARPDPPFDGVRLT